MTKAELIDYHKGEGKIYIPNEIFEDLQNAIEKPTHIAFAYSYHYFINYLYRYNKYSIGTMITQKFIKQFLGFSPIYKEVDYIIKKAGILDSIGYTRTTTDYPVSYTLDHKNRPEFTTIREWKRKNPIEAKFVPQDRNFKIKYPVKAFYRNALAEQNEYMNGTFYDAEKTHGIHVKTFLDMMEDDEEELKCIGFYIYGFLACRIGQYGGDWTSISKNELVKSTKLSNGTIDTYIERLQKRKFLKIIHQNFFDNSAHLANVYKLS